MKQEDEIFKKLKNGDSAAVDELIKLYYGDIFRYCCFRFKRSDYGGGCGTGNFFESIPISEKLPASGEVPRFFVSGGIKYLCGYLQKKTVGDASFGSPCG